MHGFAVVYSRPGNISLAIDKIKGNEALARDFQEGLAAIRGIKRVETDAARGLVAVFYDKQQVMSLTSLLALKAVFTTFFPEVNPMHLASRLSQSL